MQFEGSFKFIFPNTRNKPYLYNRQKKDKFIIIINKNK